MSKITFRADEELVERIEARDASKSEIMREALREYLDDADRDASAGRDRPAREGSTDRDRLTREGSVPRQDVAPNPDVGGGPRSADSLDGLLAERVDELVAERLAAWETRERGLAAERDRAQDVNVNVTLETDRTTRSADAEARPARASDAGSDGRATDASSDAGRDDPPVETETACGQCGESLSDDHVYCPNCGEKATNRLFCECGDEVRSDWGFCPGCGRRTPTADVLDRS